MAKETKWVLVADAAHARIFEVDAREGVLGRAPVREAAAQTAASRDIASDRPGRTFDSGGQGRHAKEPPTDPHRHEKRRFAHVLAGILEDERKKEAFGELLIVAPPQMLGDLRAELSAEVQKLVEVEIAKNLSMLPAHKLKEQLDEALRG